jgi:hypothetical protein
VLYLSSSTPNPARKNAASFLLCLKDLLKINLSVCLRENFDVEKMFASFTVNINFGLLSGKLKVSGTNGGSLSKISRFSAIFEALSHRQPKLLSKINFSPLDGGIGQSRRL